MKKEKIVPPIVPSSFKYDQDSEQPFRLRTKTWLEMAYQLKRIADILEQRLR